MGEIKSVLGRLVYWILLVCLPAAGGLAYLESKATLAPPGAKIQELQEMNVAIKTIPPDPAKPAQTEAIPVKPTVGTQIATGRDEQPQKDSVKSEKIEELITLISRSQAAQMALLKEKGEDVNTVKKALAEQSSKLEMILDLTRKQEQQFAAISKKTDALEAKVGEKSRHESANLAKMVKLFAVIPPEKLAKIVEGIEDEPLTAIMGGMKEKDIAQIMSALPAKRAAALTLKMGDFSGAHK